MKTKSKTTSLITIATFLVFELLAFAAFSLANSLTLYAIIGFALLALLFIGTSIQIKHKGFTDLAIFVVPLILYGIFLIVSPFSQVLDSMTTTLAFVAFLSFTAVGAYMRLNQDFKISTALLVIYGALALLVLISFGWTMIQFQPFYTITYANSYLYYDGEVSTSPIGEIAYFLIGFSFHKVSIEYFSLFPSILSTAVVALFFINPKEQKKTFIAYCVYAIVGIFPLIMMPTLMTGLTDICLIILYVLVFIFTKVIKNPSKIVKYCLVIGGSLIGLLFLIVLINANAPISFFSSNAFLNKLFNTNHVVAGFNEILKGVFSSNILGFIGYTSNSILFDNFMMSGLLGGLLFIFAMVWGIISLYKMCKLSNISVECKALIVCFVAAFLGYSLINYDMQPYLYYQNFIPFFASGPFLIVLFFMGYSFKLKYQNETQKEEKAEEQIPSSDVVQSEEFNI